jgi:thioredoxin-like negative regulator of GroEL
MAYPSLPSGFRSVSKGIPVTSLTMAALVNALLATVALQTCREAYLDAKANGKPLVILVSAEWCPPCKQMKQHVLPRVDNRLWRRVAFAVLDCDRQPELASRVTGERSGIPQLIMYTPTSSGWTRRMLYGYHDVDQVERFLVEGIPRRETAPRSAESTRALTRIPAASDTR